jgi:hypothetical protein
MHAGHGMEGQAQQYQQWHEEHTMIYDNAIQISVLFSKFSETLGGIDTSTIVFKPNLLISQLNSQHSLAKQSSKNYQKK